jgi:hypothetical protein
LEAHTGGGRISRVQQEANILAIQGKPYGAMWLTAARAFPSANRRDNSLPTDRMHRGLQRVENPE